MRPRNVKFDTERTFALLKMYGISKTDAANAVMDVRDTPESKKRIFQRYFSKGEIPANLLWELAFRLDVSPRYLSGELDKPKSFLEDAPYYAGFQPEDYTRILFGLSGNPKVYSLSQEETQTLLGRIKVIDTEVINQFVEDIPPAPPRNIRENFGLKDDPKCFSYNVKTVSDLLQFVSDRTTKDDKREN